MTNQETITKWLDNLDGEFSTGKNSTGSIFFEGDKIFSYGYHFPLAWFQGGRSVVINVSKYSRTTSKHQTTLRAELENYCINEFHEVDIVDFRKLIQGIPIK